MEYTTDMRLWQVGPDIVIARDVAHLTDIYNDVGAIECLEQATEDGDVSESVPDIKFRVTYDEPGDTDSLKIVGSQWGNVTMGHSGTVVSLRAAEWATVAPAGILSSSEH